MEQLTKILNTLKSQVGLSSSISHEYLHSFYTVFEVTFLIRINFPMKMCFYLPPPGLLSTLLPPMMPRRLACVPFDFWLGSASETFRRSWMGRDSSTYFLISPPAAILYTDQWISLSVHCPSCLRADWLPTIDSLQHCTALSGFLNLAHDSVNSSCNKTLFELPSFRVPFHAFLTQREKDLIKG